MLTPTRTRLVNRGRLLPIVEGGGWTFSAIEAESRRKGRPVATATLSRINRGVIDLSEAHATTLAAILGLDPALLRDAINGVSGGPTDPNGEREAAATERGAA